MQTMSATAHGHNRSNPVAHLPPELGFTCRPS